MDIIRSYVVTLVATLIFMTSVELIAPDNSMKKYLKFILGLILISVLLTPIIKFFSHGQKAITDAIEGYERELTTVDSDVNTTDNSNIEYRKQSFIYNFNQRCDKLLKDKYKNMKFSTNIDCEVDFNKMTYTVNSLTVYVSNSNIKPIKKIDIGDDKARTQSEDDATQRLIKDFLSTELEINREKIEVIYS